MNNEELRKEYEEFVGAQELLKENRDLQRQIDELKPMARLASVMSMMEGLSFKQHLELRKRDADWDELHMKYFQLQLDVNHLHALVDELRAKERSKGL